MSILNNQTFNSVLGLKGLKPVNQPGSTSDSITHVTNDTPPQAYAKHSKFDLDGQIPSKYTDNLPK